jgi:hypothetical protein
MVSPSGSVSERAGMIWPQYGSCMSMMLAVQLSKSAETLALLRFMLTEMMVRFSGIGTDAVVEDFRGVLVHFEGFLGVQDGCVIDARLCLVSDRVDLWHVCRDRECLRHRGSKVSALWAVCAVRVMSEMFSVFALFAEKAIQFAVTLFTFVFLFHDRAMIYVGTGDVGASTFVTDRDVGVASAAFDGVPKTVASITLGERGVRDKLFRCSHLGEEGGWFTNHQLETCTIRVIKCPNYT